MNNPVIKQALDYEAYFNSNDELRKEYLAREESILDENEHITSSDLSAIILKI